MDSISQQIERMLLEQSKSGQQTLDRYGSGLDAANIQDQKSIDQLGALYNDKSKLETPIWGAMGQGIANAPRNGNFGEGILGGLSAGIDAQNKNRALNFSREEKLAQLSSLQAKLTRGTAGDELSKYDARGKMATSLGGTREGLADVRLDDMVYQNDLDNPKPKYQQVIDRYYDNPGDFAGPNGAEMVKAAFLEKKNSDDEAQINARLLPEVITNDVGVPDPKSQEEFLKSFDPGYAATLKKMSNYELDPTRLSKRVNKTTGKSEYSQAIEDLSLYDRNYDVTKFPARAAMRKSVQAGGAYGIALNSANLVVKHVGGMAEAFDGMKNTDYDWYNKPANAIARAKGDKDLQYATGKFEAEANAVASELAKVFKGVGATDAKSIQEWRDRLNPNMSPSEFQGAVDAILQDLLKSRVDVIKNQYQSTMEKPFDVRFLDPKTKEILKKHKVDLKDYELDDASGSAGAAEVAVTPGDLKTLQEHHSPDDIADFNSHYGEGAAEKILGGK